MAFADDCIGEAAAKAVAALKDGDVLLLENTRFHAGEEKNDPAFVKELATLGDLYVNDAFSAAHRAHASTEGLARVLPGLRRPHHAGRARRPDEGPGGAQAPSRRHRRRRQGLDQDRPARKPRHQGRRPRHRRRHGQHLPPRHGPRSRQVPRREGSRRRRRCASSRRRARPTAPSSCPSTASAPTSSRRARTTTPTASTRSPRTR